MIDRTFQVTETERLDRIARNLYGTEKGGTVEALLDANPGLAAGGFFVAAGTVLIVPKAIAPAGPATTRPWD